MKQITYYIIEKLNKYLIIVDNLGFYYKPLASNFNKGYLPKIFYKSNPYTIQNIKLWCKLNNKPFELLSEKYEGNNKKLKWKCLNYGCNEVFESNWNCIQSGCTCGFCAGQQVGLSNCLATKNPELAKEWHSTKNNDLTPFDVTSKSNKRVWWKCNKNSKHEWKAIVYNRNVKNSSCPYCNGNLPSEDYNLLVYNPKLCEEWDYSKNKKTPEEYCPNSESKVYWVCNDCNYNWKATIAHRNNDRGCPECKKSIGEKKIKEIFDLKNIFYIPQKSFENLLGLGNGLLSYDFYLPDYNLLVEYQGIQHKKPIDFKGKGKKYAQEQFEIQQEHDKLKYKYASKNNIKLLEIWYYDFDRIEEILKNYLN